MSDEMFIKKYEELLDKGYCNCNEMNCLDNDTPRRILNIVKGTKLEAKQLLIENQKRKEVIDRAIDYIEKHRIREKALLDVDAVIGLLKEV